MLKILAFILLGEFIFQVHKHWGIEQVNDITDQQENSTKPANTPNTIYLLGDSYTKGLGIKKENRLINTINVDGYYVADYSHSSDNWVDYIGKIRSIEKELTTGDIIVIGVNWNDVSFNKGSINKLFSLQHSDSNKAEIKKLGKNTQPKGIRNIVHFLYRNSAMINFLSSNIQNTLRRKGIPLPIGDFHYLKEIAYTEKKDEMNRAMNYLQTVNKIHNTTIILYLMPDFNLTKNIGYFKNFRQYFLQFTSANGITVLDGPEMFIDADDGYYCISTHDGHPNDKAHILMGRQISSIITADKVKEKEIKN
ncbi:MAG: hypothetical protein KDC07_00500 [Chitinophagaceae bacterium]|nr:hypothetical protein [Chitinophagaceae bacterium]